MTDLEGIGAIVTGVAGVLTSAVVWYRSNRLANSKAQVEVAANYADTIIHTGHGDEITELRKRVSELDAAFVAQAAEQSRLKQQVSSLEAMMIGISQHHDNLMLCDPCKRSNARVLDALSKTLRAAGVSNTIPGALTPSTD
jgi:hypothetical protein